MLRQACAVTLVLLVTLGMGVDPTQQAEASSHGGWSDADELRVFEYDVIFAQRDFFRLDFDIKDPKGGGEHYERYYFAIRPHEGTIGLQEGLAVGSFTVTHQSTSDLVCRGTLGNLDGFNKYQFCDDLKTGRWYEITYTVPTPADLVLFGVNPIGPVKHTGDPPL